MRNSKELYNFNSSSERREGDFYPTPDWVADALLDNCSNDYRFAGDVWECACGKGDLAERIKKKCPLAKVYASDLYNRGYGDSGIDFLKSRRNADWIVTNPPFEMGFEFMRRARKLARKGFALLFPLRYLAGKRRSGFYKECPPNRIIVIPGKVDFTGAGNAKMEFCWFLWDERLDRECKVIWHSPEDKNQLKLFAA